MLRIVIAATVLTTLTAASYAWTDRTYMERGTDLHSKPNEKSKVIAVIPRSQTINGASNSIDRDCSYETKNYIFCKVKWRGKVGYIDIDDLLELGDYDDF